ncbi:hypothetical protein QC764_0050760 [Podospora pseudoanserina]|uniref:Uncharacterized protein n=1 Tax=Podospora pseudoanserina TaxID=2609844 RepID=A0ABR0ICZ8_9PEZI|nr:hypothetical protein QC764_0050760 [Podospora pseudoanserina]
MDGPSPRDPHTAAASDSSSPALPQKHHFLTHGRLRLDRQPQESGERRRRQVPCNYSTHRTASTTATLKKTPRETPLRRGPSHQTPCGLRLCLFFSLTRKPHYFTEEAFSDAQRHLAGLLLFFVSFV